MRERERLLWSILIILLLIIAGYEGYNAYRMGQKIRGYQEELTHETLGSEDPQLRQTVEELETDLQGRMTYEFHTERDPLDLSQVIHAKRFLASLGFSESLESQTKLRLSCTVIAQQPAAVIKFQGRSQILRKGDTINGYTLTEIRPQSVLLVRGGERLLLATEKAPETLEAERQRRSGSGDITVSAPDSITSSINF